jgi:hypothetical protein
MWRAYLYSLAIMLTVVAATVAQAAPSGGVP